MYYPGTIASANGDDNIFVSYDDGDIESLDLALETWCPCDILASGSADFPSIQYDALQALRQMLDTNGQKPLLPHNAQGSPQYVRFNSHEVQELEFKNQVKMYSHI